MKRTLAVAIGLISMSIPALAHTYKASKSLFFCLWELRPT
jgi:hypothetical protein